MIFHGKCCIITLNSDCIFSAFAVDINIMKGRWFIMKKFLGVLVAVTLCLCMLAPAAFAADSSFADLVDGLKGVDLSSINTDELSQMLGGLNLEGFDVEAIKSALESGDSSQLAGLDAALQNLGTDDSASAGSSDTADSASSGSDSALGGLSDMLGGVDLSWITDAFSNPDALSSVTDMLSGLGGSGDFDVSSLMDTISGAFSGSGIDLSSITSGIDLGSFDIGSILGGLGGSGDSGDGSASGSGDAASGATDAVSGIMDKLMSGLSGLGLDTSMIEGLLDNEIVDFFANLYIGLGQVDTPVEDVTTTKPAVVTTKPPKTGDTSAVVVAVATLAVASAAAFVCLKKKED